MHCGLVLSEKGMSEASRHIRNHKKNDCIRKINQAVTEACRPIFKSIPDLFHTYLPPPPPWRLDPIPSYGLPLRDFTITLRHTTLGRTPLDKWSARRRDLYLTTHNTHQRERERDIHAPDGIRTHNSSKRAAADPRLRPCGHRHRFIVFCTTNKLYKHGLTTEDGDGHIDSTAK